MLLRGTLAFLASLFLIAAALAQQTADAAHRHNQQGIAFARTGNHVAAVKEFREAITLRSDYAEAHFNLAVSLVQLGELEGALEAFQTAVRLRPLSAIMHLALASALLQYGQ